VLDGHAFGGAGGAGGEEHVRKIAGSAAGLGAVGGLASGGLLGAGVVLDRGEHAARGAIADHALEPRLLGDLREARRWIAGVEGDVGRARAEHAEERGDERRRAPERDADQRPRPRALRAQTMGDGVRPGLEARIGDALVAVEDRERVPRAIDLSLEELVHAELVWEGHRGVVPGDEQAPSLLGIEQIDRGDGRVGIGEEGAEDLPELARHARRRRGIEELGGVAERPFEALGARVEGEMKLERAVALLRVRALAEHQAGLHSGRRGPLVARMRRFADRAGVSHPSADGERDLDRDAQENEAARWSRALGRRADASVDVAERGEVGGDGEIVGAGAAMEEQRKGREQKIEERRAFALGERTERGMFGWSEQKTMLGVREARHGRAWAIGGEVERVCRGRTQNRGCNQGQSRDRIAWSRPMDLRR
jgi:hypothetical protein